MKLRLKSVVGHQLAPTYLEATKRDFFSSEDFQWSGTYHHELPPGDWVLTVRSFVTVQDDQQPTCWVLRLQNTRVQSNILRKTKLSACSGSIWLAAVSSDRTNGSARVVTVN